MSRTKLLFLWLICVAAGIVSAVWMAVAIIAGSPRALIIAKGFDYLTNKAFGDDQDKYISSRCWRYRDEPQYARWVKIIDSIFNDSNHCKNSFEGEWGRYE
jgi:hypothetical protein